MNDRVKLTLRVAAKQALAFDVFTEDLDAWWRHGKRFRIDDSSVLKLAPGVGGALTETIVKSGKPRTFTIGTVTVWDPPRRLVLEWRPINFKERDPSTEVEVTFERAIGHSGEGTLVTLEHRGWSRVRADHPVRHQQAASEFMAGHARWWADLGASLQMVASERESAVPRDGE